MTMSVAVQNNFCNELYSFLFQPYVEGVNQLDIALSGKVSHVAQEAISKTERLSTVDLSGRVLHLLMGISLLVPVINSLFFQIFTYFDVLRLPNHYTLVSSGATLTSATTVSTSTEEEPVGLDLFTRTVPAVRPCPPVSLTGNIFRDDEILKVYHFIPARRQELQRGDLRISVNYTSENKGVIQQQAGESCSAAAAAMLIHDKGGLPNIEYLITRTTDNYERVSRDIEEAGYTVILTPFHQLHDSLAELRNRLLQHGSAVVRIKFPAIGHFVVVDEISPDLREVRIRDPYHGWTISISGWHFRNYWMRARIQAEEGGVDDHIVQIRA